MITLQSIKEAKSSFKDFIKTTYLDYSPRLSNEYGANIYLKREDKQIVRSYKIRGAFNLINSLPDEEKKSGIVCASAGNHAQGVAITCRELQIKGTIFMPLTTPEQKVYKTKKFGGEFVDVVLMGDTFDEALSGARDFEKQYQATFVHPFDDERIITGQATVGLEIIEQFEGKGNIDYIICPIGGGGLISGMISIFAGTNTKIIGVEPLGAPTLKHSIDAGEIRTLHKIDTFVDGAAVKRPGDKTFEIVKNAKVPIYLSPENRICSTIMEYLKEDGLVLEPAGALSSDILKDREVQEMIKGKNVVLIVSGGNFDFERLPEVKERSLKYEGLKRYFLISFPQRPGALKEFLSYLGSDDDITRFEYLKKSNKEKAPAFVGIQTSHKDNFLILSEKLKHAGIHFEDITDNDMYFDLLI
ncbi:MAG: threonine ammonia-lyase IlvA [Candidatus Gracilibacteria bacterium]|nr:threonine ammonia-lyase IlvA [Candidatus Gracilibacteria bacterium]